MNDRENRTGDGNGEDGDDPRLTPEMRAALDRVRRDEAAAQAAGRWKTRPLRRGDRFAGPLGVGADGQVNAHADAQEAQEAYAERRRRREQPGENGPGEEGADPPAPVSPA